MIEPIARPSSPVKEITKQNGHPSSSSAAPISPTKAASPVKSSSISHDDSSMQALRDEIDILKEEMAKRDTLIRKLEVENERLRANERRVREVIGGN